MTLKKGDAYFMALLSQYLASHNIRFTTLGRFSSLAYAVDIYV